MLQVVFHTAFHGDAAHLWALCYASGDLHRPAYLHRQVEMWPAVM